LPPELHEPIKVFRPTIAHGPDAGPNTPDELALAAFLHAVRKLELLFRVHGVPRTGNDPVDYLRLSLALARQLYPGFHLEPMAKGQYEHNRSNAVSLTMLLADVERVKQEKGIRSDRAAIGELLSPRRRSRWWSNYGQPTLQNWLLDARNPKKNCFWQFWRWAKKPGNQGELTRLIDAFASNDSPPAKREGRRR
jgi:hypothetical protein